MTPKTDETRALARLRSACRTEAAKDLLRRALERGWPASAIEDRISRKRRRGPSKLIRRLHAIHNAASSRYYSPDEYAADVAAWERSAEAFRPLRSVCQDFKERLVLGQAVRNGWGATALTKLAESFRTKPDNNTTEANPKLFAHRRAIQFASERLYEADKPLWLMQLSHHTEKELTTECP